MRGEPDATGDDKNAGRERIRILIVGFGNPLRSDDGVGWHAAQQLSRDDAPSGVKILACQQLTPEIASFASPAEKVLFVDAAHQGVPGEIKCRRIVPATSSGEYSHELSPAALLTLAQTLYGRCPPAWLLTITGESFATGDSLSPVVSAAIPALLERVKRFIDSDEK
ncbi:MAG: hydrogenase maturation protease [Terriglobales bacterium]